MGSTGKVDTPQGVSRLEGFGNRVLNQTGGSRRMILQQLEEALSTGAVGARTPLIQRAVESSLRSASDAYGQAEEMLGARAGTPIGQSILAGARTQGALATSQIPTDIIGAFLQQAPGIVGGFSDQAVSALMGGTQMRLQQEMFNDQQSAQFFHDLKDSLQSIARMGMSGGKTPTTDFYGQAMDNYDPGANYGASFAATTPMAPYGY